MKPIAYDIDMSIRNTANLSKKGGFGVKYKCPTCGKKFTQFISEKDLRYCYNCGESLFWGGVITFINSTQSDTIKEIGKNYCEESQQLYIKGLLEQINHFNENCDNAEPVFIEETE